ncbi:MAG: branched-chain amino acid ABC transporter permease [Lachnospiraceae bacterium]|jgi:branched-chain amino acid transport system permease protein|nr:branched-chain amino acid ABC transporter permease [Lachnospiraceae bacterium]
MRERLAQIPKPMRENLITFGIVVVAFIVMQILISLNMLSHLMTGLLVPLCVYVIMAVSLNLTVGILGELSLGHAGFMCLGAFAGAFFTKVMENVITFSLFRFILAILIGALVAGVFGLLIGLPVLRFRGDYLAIVTLAFGEIIKNIINALFVGLDDKGFHFSLRDSLSLGMGEEGRVIINGAQGIVGMPRDSTFLIGTILVIITLFIVLNLINSRDGRAIMSIRDNLIASESVGIDVTRYKLMAFTISAALAGVAGVLYSHNLNSVQATPRNFGFNMSIMILVFVVLGGIGNIRGSIIAAVVLTVLPEVLRGISDQRMLIYSVILIVMMIFNWSPKVLEWREKHSLKEWLSRLRKRKAKV